MPTIDRRRVARAPNRPMSLKRKQLASAVAAALAVPAIGMQTVYAQEPTAQQPEEITVTGSRIVRRDYDANSPLQTVDRSAFENQNSISLETALNDLPQFVPAAQGLTQLQDQSQMTDNFTTLTSGASTVSLRGLGANRNLVLLDGYRAVPVNATMAVDVNSIPAAAIERVEVITGGASSVYGADAVAGVVNFILKKNFEGLDLDVQTGSMQNGKGSETRASALFGVTSGDNKGNIMVGMELASRDAIHADDTEFWHHALRDGTTYPTQLIYTGPYLTTDAANAPSRAVVDQIFNKAPAGVVGGNGAARSRCRGLQFLLECRTVRCTRVARRSATARPPPAQAARPVCTATTARRIRRGPTRTMRVTTRSATSTTKARSSNTSCRSRPTFRLIAAPCSGEPRYDLSDSVSAYAQFLNVSSKTRRYFTDSPAVAGWGNIALHGNGVYAPSLNADGSTNAAYRPGGQYGLNCAATGGCTKSQAFPVSPELAAVLDSRPDPEATWSFNYGMDFGDFGAPGNLYRSVFSETRTNQGAFGLKGKIDGIDGTLGRRRVERHRQA